MDRDIQLTEVLQCIKELTVGKRPGRDGFTALYYRKLSDILAPHLTAMFNAVKDGHAFTPSLLTANIVMIPKPNRDHSSWANFRPISLVNVDMKILTNLGQTLKFLLATFDQKGPSWVCSATTGRRCHLTDNTYSAHSP